MTTNGSASLSAPRMPVTSPFEILAEEIGAVAGRIERESGLRIAAAISDLERRDAQRELRIVRLESLATERLASIKDGTDGEPGAQGEHGADGKDGASGPPGEKGEAGEKGERGPDGKDGATGASGRDGIDGQQGNDGSAGLAGKDGRDGVDGKDGARGERGQEGPVGKFAAPKAWKEGAVHYESDLVFFDGATWCARCDTAQTPPHEDWSPVALKGVDAPVWEVRGLYDEKASYRKFDLVTFNGSEWRAKKDGPGPLPGDGWAIGAQKGKRGDKGERGDRGELGKEGKQGPAAPAIVERRIEGYTLIDTMSDGSIVACDMRPTFEAYHGEVRKGA